MFDAKVVPVLIASPSDVGAARLVIAEGIADWNSSNFESGVVLIPVMWERDATPELGAPPQEIIDRQLADKCDIVIACFSTRLGTPTADDESGTVHEIERALSASKPVAVYFSDEPVSPSTVDGDEKKRLDEYHSSLLTRGLVDTFSAPEELRRKITALLTRRVRELNLDAPGVNTLDPSATRVPGVRLLANVNIERILRSLPFDRGQDHRTVTTLVVSNAGAADAHDVSIRLLSSESGEPIDMPKVLDADRPIAVLAAGAVVRYPIVSAFGVDSQFEIEMAWTENGENRQVTQTLRI